MNNCQLYYISDTSVSRYQHSAIAKLGQQLFILIDKYKLNEPLDVVDAQWCGKVLNMPVMPFVSPSVFHFSLRSTALCAETANPD